MGENQLPNAENDAALLHTWYYVTHWKTETEQPREVFGSLKMILDTKFLPAL